MYVTTAAVGMVGLAGATWPLINSLNPSADVLAVSVVEIDLSSLEVGGRATVVWRGQPIFIDRRTDAQIARSRAEDNAVFKDPELDQDRVQKAEWLIVIGICTHLGCVPLGQNYGDQRGDWGGWFCPCHGSQYDTSGRIRKGPAPKNLIVPPYVFLNETNVRIG